MNILFVNTYKPTVNTSGGIARVTCNLGNLFTLNGYNCGVAFYYDSKGETESCFDSSTLLSFNKERPVLEELAASYQVFILQIQMSKAYLHLVPTLAYIREKYGTKVIYCHHNVPFTETAGYDFNFLGFILFHSNLNIRQRIKESIWCLTSILFPRYSTRKIARRRQYVTDNVDKTILLSDSFIPSFRKYVKCPDDKVGAIGNCFTFKEKLQPKELDSKEKTVLVVSNMTERAKRISAMLRIWKMVSRSDIARDWKLILIGNGEDLSYYKKMAKRIGLKNYSFEGTQDPLPYYRKGSLLMLTSAYEGFGMVILEAQQMGCVPVVYESYESVHDLITDGRDGILVPNRNKKRFTEQLLGLMTDQQKRLEIARNCINTGNNFSTDKIFSLWKNLFDSLKNNPS